MLFRSAVPSGASIRWQGTYVPSGGNPDASSLITSGGSSTSFTMSGSSNDVLQVRGIVVNGSTAGNLQFRWAQGTSSSTNVTVKTNSFIKGMKF